MYLYRPIIIVLGTLVVYFEKRVAGRIDENVHFVCSVKRSLKKYLIINEWFQFLITENRLKYLEYMYNSDTFVSQNHGGYSSVG